MAFGKLSSVVAAVAGQALVPTGKTFGNKKRKGMGGLMQKAAEKAAPAAATPGAPAGGGGLRKAVAGDEGEGGGILSSVRRAIKRRAY